jgi:hypothetical protein
MATAFQTFRLLLVGALTLSVAAGQFCPQSVAGNCPLAQANAADHPVQGKCCCGDHCHCANCPAMHPHQQQNKKESPVNPTDGRDLVKIGLAAPLFITFASGSAAHFGSSPALGGEGIQLHTLISLHTCLRV